MAKVAGGFVVEVVAGGRNPYADPYVDFEIRTGSVYGFYFLTVGWLKAKKICVDETRDAK